MTTFGAILILGTPLLVLVACIMWTIRLRRKWRKHRGIYEWEAPGRMWVWLAFTAVWVLFWVIFTTANRTEKFGISIRNDRIANIVSLGNGSQINGSFMLGSGHIDEHLYYFFYKDVGGGSYKLDKMRADGGCDCRNGEVLIREDAASGTGYIERVYSRPNRVRRVLKPFFNPTVHERLQATYIHVPPGTVVQQFSLDINKL